MESNIRAGERWLIVTFEKALQKRTVVCEIRSVDDREWFNFESLRADLPNEYGLWRHEIYRMTLRVLIMFFTQDHGQSHNLVDSPTCGSRLTICWIAWIGTLRLSPFGVATANEISVSKASIEAQFGTVHW
jgi:hypothetical protein